MTVLKILKIFNFQNINRILISLNLAKMNKILMNEMLRKISHKDLFVFCRDVSYLFYVIIFSAIAHNFF